MAMADEAQQKIDVYLNRIRGRLRGLRAEERREILEELRSHLVEKAAAGGMSAGHRCEFSTVCSAGPV